MLSSGILSLIVYVTVRFPAGDVPVIAAEVYLASDLSRPRHSVDVDAGAADAALPFEPGLDAVILLRRRDAAYYLHGPLRWPSESRAVAVDGGARRTVSGPVPREAAVRSPIWIAAEGTAGAEWPRCTGDAGRWHCVGVPADAAGIVSLQRDAPVLYAAVRPAPPGGDLEVPVRSAAWATIVTLEGAPGDESARVQVLAPRRSPVRARAARQLLERAPGTGVEPLAGRRYLVSGIDHRDDLLLQVDGPDVALTRLALSTWSASLLQPLQVMLEPAVATTGRVVDRAGRAAGGARLVVAEIVEGGGATGSVQPLKRQVGELESGSDGTFTLRGLRAGRFELLGLHPRLGRGTLTFEPGGRPLVLRLDPGRRVAGRVLRDGVPLAGVWVDVPASHAAYLAAGDPMDVLAPAAVTGADGRFEVVLAPRVGNELRLDDRGIVTRLPLPPVGEGARVDLGDVTLRGSIAVRVTYAGDERCAIVAAGPLGRTGMTLAEARVLGPGVRLLTLSEAGRWLLELRCPRGMARADPPVLDVPAQAAEWSVHVATAPP